MSCGTLAHGRMVSTSIKWPGTLRKQGPDRGIERATSRRDPDATHRGSVPASSAVRALGASNTKESTHMSSGRIEVLTTTAKRTLVVTPSADGDTTIAIENMNGQKLAEARLHERHRVALIAALTKEGRT